MHVFEYIASPTCALVKERREMELFDAHVYGRGIATRTAQEVRHKTYNPSTQRWVLINVFHADGTATNEFGELRRWTGNREHPWEVIEGADRAGHKDVLP